MDISKFIPPTLSTLAGAVTLSLFVSAQAAAAQDASPFHGGVAESPRINQKIQAGSVAVLRDTRPKVLRRMSAIGPAKGDVVMSHMQLVLKRSDQRNAALEAFMTAQQDPQSPDFHHWLTAEEYGQRFGVVDQDIEAASAWLRDAGFTVNGVYPNRMQIDFSGTVAQVNRTFHTQQKRYLGGMKSGEHIANSSDISIPTALTPVVAGVAGLADLRPSAMHTPIRVAKRELDDAADSSTNTSSPQSTSANGDTKEITGKAKTTSTHGEGIWSTGEDGVSTRNYVPADMQTIYNLKPLHDQGIRGSGVTIAVVESGGMVDGDWTDFVLTFGLQVSWSQFQQIQPPPPAGVAQNCYDPGRDAASESTNPASTETILDAEWATAMAPGANIIVAACANDALNNDGTPVTNNLFDGMYIAAMNVINSPNPPDIISASYGAGEDAVDSASATQLDNMWQQAAAEGISVFVSTGDSGTNPDFNGGNFINSASSMNTLAASPYVTAVGGTDFADILDGNTANYFSSQPDTARNYGTANSYVPEIPWNQSCGNSVAAKASGFSNPRDFCWSQMDQNGGVSSLLTMFMGVQLLNSGLFTAEAGSGGASVRHSKPQWQAAVYGAAKDQTRDVPDVALYAGSYTFNNKNQDVVLCTATNPCARGAFPNKVSGVGGTSLASPMFAGIQALVVQAAKSKQGPAAPVLYALAQAEYGRADASSPPASLAACSADNPNSAGAGCVFHNVVRGGISTNCLIGVGNCSQINGTAAGITTQTADGSSYAEYAAQPGWSIASGLGSVDAQNLVKAWLAYLKQNGPAN